MLQMDLELLTYKKRIIGKYKDDEQFNALVNRTYDYFNEILSKKFLIDELEKQKRFSFDDEEDEELVQETQDKFDDQIVKETNQESKTDLEDTFLFSKTSSINPQRMSELMDIINGNAIDEENKEKQEQVQEEDEIQDDQDHWLNKIIDVVYNLLIAVIIVFLALILQILFSGDSSIVGKAINIIINGYVDIINFIFGVLFNVLHI